MSAFDKVWTPWGQNTSPGILGGQLTQSIYFILICVIIAYFIVKSTGIAEPTSKFKGGQ